MARSRFGARLWTGISNPWTLLLSAFGGGLAWAAGVPLPLSFGTAGAMLTAAVLVSVVTSPSGERPQKLRRGTRQEELVVLLDGHVRSLRSLRSRAQPGVVQSQAEYALAAADAARPFVLQVASAVDALDEAIAATGEVYGHAEHATDAIKRSVGRLKVRRAKLFDRLTAAVDEVATVYAGLLELSATANTLGVTVDDSEVSAVNDSVTLLQMTFAELEADAAALPADGLL